MSWLITRTVKPSAFVLLFATSACSQTQASSTATPSGEDAVTCSAFIFAANNLVEGRSDASSLNLIKSKYLIAMTRYGSAYAFAKGISEQEVRTDVKLKAYRLVGTIPSDGDKVRSEEIVARAKMCVEAI